MNLFTPDFSSYQDHPEKAAEIFARQIHDTWGVGIESASCGGTGILLFLSVIDRTIYFSRGSALEPILTDRRLDKTIEGMKRYLSEQQYSTAILWALRELDNYLIAGEPDWKERAYDIIVSYIGYLLILGFAGLTAMGILHERKQRREYAKVASHLDELDRARAEALQGRFQAISCPICLENFQCTYIHNKEETRSELETLTRKGSDGLPLKLLRCGHVFDDTCWAEWISSGHHGKVDKCPICQQDVGKSRVVVDEAPVPVSAAASVRTAVSSEANASAPTVDDNSLLREEEARNRALRQYTHDRNFRLVRLGSRYPQFVRPQQIQAWSQVGYDGSLARDPSFLNNDPVRQAAAAASKNNSSSRCHGSGSSGFGGGSSGGGRGGRW